MLWTVGAARFRYGQLTGGEEGRLEKERARAFFRRESVVDPERLVGALAPGFDLS